MFKKLANGQKCVTTKYHAKYQQRIVWFYFF